MQMQSLSTLNPQLLRGFQTRRRRSLLLSVVSFWRSLLGSRPRYRLPR